MIKKDAREEIAEAVPAPEAVPLVLPVEAPTPPPDVPEVTARSHFSGRLRDPVVKAFISCEERAHGTRKLPESEWAQLFSDFLAVAR